MINPLPLTVLIAAKDEERNIGRCLASLSPAERIVVIDSHSKDRTAIIAAEQGAEVVQFEYSGGYPKKRQWALDTLTITTPWILLLDADEAVPPELWQEIADVHYEVKRGRCILHHERFSLSGTSLPVWRLLP